MGSCEDPAALHEPFCSQLIQDPSSECLECSEAVPDSSGSNADLKSLARNGNAGCVSSGSGVQDVAGSAGIELVSECVNVPSSVEEKGLEEDVCGVRKDCLDEIPMERVQSRGKNDGLVNVLETIGMSSVVMNLDGSHAHCGKQCKHEAESVRALGAVEDFVNGLPQITTETHDEAVSSLGCEKHEELFCESCSLLSTVEQDKQESAIVPETATVMVKKSVAVSGLQSESIGSDMNEGIDGLATIATTEIGNHHTVDSSPLCGSTAELEQLSCLLEGVVRPDSNDTASGTSSERAILVIKNRNVNLTAIVNGSIREVAQDLTDSLVVTDTDAHDDSVQVLGCGSPKEVIPSSHLPRNNNEGSNMSAEKPLVRVEDICVDLAIIENDSVLDIMRENICSAAAIETENHGKTPYKQCFEVHARLLPVKCHPSNGAEQDKQSGNDSQEADATKERGVLLVGPDIQSHNQVLPTVQQRISSESVSIEGPQSNCDQSEHLTPGCSFTEPSMGEKIKSIAAAEFSNQILSSQGFDKSMESISLTSPSEEGVQGDEGKKDSCFFSACVEGDMGVKKEESDACVTVNSGSAVDHSGDMNHEGMDHARASGDCGSEAKLLHIALPPSGRSPGIRKSSRKAQTKRTVKKCKKKEKFPDPHGSAEIFLEYARKKRSCFSKLARSSKWGLLGNVTQDFILSNGLSCDIMKSHASKKPRVGRGTGKRMNNRTSHSSRSRKSSEKHHASTGRIRLKVKIGPDFGQSGLSFVLPKMIGTSASTDVVISDAGSESCQGINFGIPNFASDVQNNLEDEKSAHVLQCFDNKPDCESSSVDVLVAGKDVEGTMFSKKSDGDAADNGIPSSIEVEASGVATENRYTDPGTSPDSEVINTVPEGKPGLKCTEDFSDGTLTNSKAYAASSDVASGKRSKKKDVLPPACNAVDESPCLTSLKKSKPSKKSGQRQKKDVGFSSCEVLSTSTCPTASSNSFGRQELALEQFVLSRETEPYISWEDSKVETSEKVDISCEQDVAPGMSGSQLSENLLPSTKSKGDHLPRRSGGVRKERSKASNAATCRKTSNCRKKGNKLKTVHKNKMKRKGVSECACKEEDDPKIGNLTEDSVGKTHLSNDIPNVDSSNLELSSSAVMDQYFPSDDAWVRCDDCYKWRRIPVSIVDYISEANCQWICKDNMDKAFADCSIPQEKSNAEINAELGLSDVDADAYDFPSDFKGLECTQKPTSKENEFAHITTNQFSHRSRKTQTIDEIMVCHCKASVDGNLGCGDECLNRMLNIECVQGTCPCGELCSNQQFQKRNYAKMKWNRCGKKGFGLRMEEDIPKGQFLIEYVGEVLDVHVYAERLKEYASKGHKHFYFMTLDGSEVIDACAKGNLGRFINHSCDPNCRTEKWVVNGEICIGLFALRDIKKGEEVTFDYNFVRVVGAAAKRCYCGSLHCRGYIGGDPTDTEVIDQVDSDEEFPEPVMLEEGEAGDDVKNAISKHKDKMDSSRKAIGKLEVTAEIEDFVDQSTSVSQSHGLLELNDVKGYSSSGPLIDLVPQTEDATSKCLSAVQQEISVEDSMKKASLSIERWETLSNTTLSKSSPEGVADRKSRTVMTEDKRVFVKSRFFIKTSHRSDSLKKGKFPIGSTNASKVPLLANKTQGLSIKPKKIMEGTSNGHFEAVQEKLNELLDAEGGISKRKDAPKGYLKLLLLTAASGASGNGQSIQSNRELSMILDALLKTKSRMVLLDIINKNGLRMLHNIMKQYRRDFKKIPILRKLLKVLEYLAVREILTLEHISGGPPFPGMESFSESMLSLTEHDDKQVHQIARSFRDRWIPRHIRNRSYMDRDDGRMEFLGGSNCNWASAAGHWHDQGVKNTEAVDCKTKPLTAAVDAAFHEGSSSSGVKTRKRKSRWDQPANGSTGSRSSVLDDGDRASREYSYCPHCARNYYPKDGSSSVNAGRQNIHEDGPPGFFSPSLVPSNASLTVSNHPQQSICHSKSPVAGVVVGLPQSKFISLLPVSYGIPMSIMQQVGSPSAEFIENWTIAPGMPFYPFPPLPPLPSSHKKESPPCTVGSVAIEEAVEQRPWDSHDTASCPSEDNPSTLSQPGTDFPGASDHQASKRIRGTTFDLGRRYFRQQKWIKMPPPWIRNRNGWGYIGDKSKGGGMCSTDSGSITNQHKNSYYSPDGSCRVEKSSNYFNQHAQNLNEH